MVLAWLAAISTQQKGKSMKSNSLSAFTLILGASLLCGCAARHLMHQQHQQQDMLELPNVPASLKVQPGQVLMLIAKASGVQIYECGIDKGDASRYRWNFKAPEAELFNSHGKSIGKHYGGPTWESTDGSKVVGQVVASENAMDANSIPWLLLNVKSNSGSGVFAKTTSIQRLHTVSGKAPDDGCDQAHLAKELRIPYTAQYYFYD
jgi:Protein of unknown function (DUF3455)